MYGYLLNVLVTSAVHNKLNNMGLTQLAGGWGCLGGRCPPKHPQFSSELRNSYDINHSFGHDE